MALGQIAPSLTNIAKAQVAAFRIWEVIDRVPPIDSASAAGVKPELSAIRGRVEFRNVTFSYPSRPDQVVLSNFSLTIEPGQTVALVGESGSGKSTIVQLLQRNYAPTSGQILVDGVDIAEWNVRHLRDVQGLVSQEPVLLNASVEANIALGKATPAALPTRAEIEAAAKVAKAHDFVSRLPDGYGTVVGDRGAQLSGGQKQRVAIARAVIRDPRILLLDEATSALDTQSERDVQAALDALLSDGRSRTTLVIAHRLSTIVNAHRIVAMRRGEIVEQGTHAELLAIEGGLYQRLVSLQSLHREGEEGEGGAEAGSDPADGDGVTPLPGIAEGGDEEVESGDAVAAALGDLQLVNPGPATTTARQRTTSSVGGGSKNKDRSGSAAGAEGIARTTTPRTASTAAASTDHVTLELAPQGKAPPLAKSKSASLFRSKRAALTEEARDVILAETLPPVSFSRLFEYQRPETGVFILATLVSLACGAIFPAFSLLYSGVVTELFKPDAKMNDGVNMYIGLFFLLAVSAIVLYASSSGLQGFLGERLTRRLRVAVFRTILRQPMAFFDDRRNTTGRLTGRLATDAALLRGSLGERIATNLQTYGGLATGFIIGFTACWQLTLVLMATAPMMMLSGLITARLFSGKSAGRDKAYADATNTAVESLAAIRTVSAFNMQDFLLGNYEKQLVAPKREAYRQAVVSSAVYGISQGLQF
jgi:ABC-type multidrug transport system fused ATPase/permease subunit